MTRVSTPRSRAKQDRQAALLREAARLFADRGFSAVSLEEIGASVGVSGPAVYRHFAGKQALLGAVLIEVSQNLRDGGRTAVDEATDAAALVEALIGFHVDFALAHPDVIRVQDRDAAHLRDEDYETVRTLQREYVEMWIGAIEPLVDEDRTARRLRVQACFGLINSTPHSTSVSNRTSRATATLLARMAGAALLA